MGSTRRTACIAAVILGIAACGDTPTEPVKPTEVTLNVCGSALPWVGYQDGDGAWMEVEPIPTGAANSYKFTMGQRVGAIAYVQTTTCGRWTDVVYGTAEQLATMFSGDCSPPAPSTRTLHGNLVGGVAGNLSSVSLGGAFGYVFGESGSFTLKGVPDGPQDLLAHRGNAGGSDKVILRRRVDSPNGATIPLLDFNSSEAFALDSATLSIQQFAQPGLVSSSIYLANGSRISASARPASATTWYRGLPASATAAGDMHAIAVTSAGRTAGTFVGPLASHTVSLGPAVATPTITTLSSGTPMRMRMTVPVQDAYPKVARARFEVGRRPYYYVRVEMTAAYRGSATSWIFDVPDFGTASGYDASWAFPAGETLRYWEAQVYDWEPFGNVGRTIGQTWRSASVSSTPGAPLALLPFGETESRHLARPTSLDARYAQFSCSPG